MNVYLYPSNTETSLKNAYIGEYKGWKPGSNTIAYFPLAEDGLDKVGNYTLSNTGTQQTIGRKFTSSSTLNTIVSGCNTIAAWIKLNSYNTSYDGQSLILRGIATNYSILIQTVSASSTNYKNPSFNLYYNNIEYFGGQNVLSAGQGWKLVVETWDGASLKGYVDTTEYTTYTGTYPGTPVNSLLVSLSSGKTIDIDMSDVIFESSCRTADEITAYYNLTKSKYGL